MKPKSILQIIIIILLLAGAGSYAYYYIYPQYRQSKEVKESPEYLEIKEITTLKLVKTDLSEELINKYQEQFKLISRIFIEKPKSAESFWPLIAMAQIKELVGDYDGAVKALLWASGLQPESFVPYANLANLYFHQYQDFPKAEENYLKAIKPDDVKIIPYYLDLHDLYRYFYKKDTGLAEDILKQGITRFQKDYPNDILNLMAVLANYYKDLARYSEAKDYYQQILKINPNSEVAKKGISDF